MTSQPLDVLKVSPGSRLQRRIADRRDHLAPGEGIVSKRRDRPYQHGRSRSWLKVKNPASPAMTRVWEERS
jgi:hypothetical protein